MKTWHLNIMRIFVILLVMLTLTAFLPSAPAVAQADQGTAPTWSLYLAAVTTVRAPEGVSPVPAFALTPEILGTIAGAVLSILFSYIPGLNTWFAAKDNTQKRGLMALLLLITSAGVFGLGCAGILNAGIACSNDGAIQIVWIFLLGIIGNQSAYSISPRTNAVKEVKAIAARLQTYSG
jgi:hypothetical protein